MKKILLTFLWLTIAMYGIAQNSISGIVAELSGESLPGVSISIKGTTKGIISDANGNFKLETNVFPVTLVFRFVGFKEKEEKILKATSNLMIKLEPSIEAIDEVVVMGYGTIRRSDMTGSVATIQAKDLAEKGIASVAQGLQGMAAGVSVVSASGEPGGGIEVKIRGANSILGSSEPLYVIDGIPLTSGVQASSGDYQTSTNPLANLNPNDIKNIEVLKDASATAIYGSRGSNGVILITTKQATSGKPQLEFTSRTSLAVPGTPIQMMNGIQFATWQNYEALLVRPGKTEQDLITSGDLPFRGQDDLHPLVKDAWIGTDFMKEILQNPVSQEIGFNYSYANDRVKNYLSFNYSDDKGLIKTSNFLRANAKFANEYKVSDKLEFRTNLNISYTNNRRVQTSAYSGLQGVNFLAMKINPLTHLYDANGNYYQWDSNGLIVDNPLVELYETNNKLENKDVYGGLTAIVHLTSHLDLNARVNGTYRKSDTRAFWSGNTEVGYKTGGLALMSSATESLIVNDLFAQYQKKFNKNFVNAMVGISTEYNSNFLNNAKASVFQFYDLGINNLALANSRDALTSSKYTTSLLSAFGRFNYNYDDKYLITLTGRADGASVFGENNKWGFFPSMAIAWNANNEEFVKQLNVFSTLKVRLSAGSVGNRAISPYQTLATFGIGTTPSINQANTITTYSERVANPDLKWETTNSVNMGLDMGFLDNRILVTPEIYYKKTIDLLLQRAIPSASGYSVITSNLGTLQNKGIELSITGYIAQNKKLKWTTRLNLSRNVGKILTLPGIQYLDGGNLMVNAVNQSATRMYPDMKPGLVYGYIADGIIQLSDVSVIPTTNGNFGYSINLDASGKPLFVAAGSDMIPGHLKYRDIGGGGTLRDQPDGKINSDDRTFIGDTNPDFIFGFSNDLYWKNFSLNVFFNGSVGNDLINVSKMLFQNGLFGNNQTQEWYNKRWTRENPHNDIHWASGGQNYVSTSCVENGTYIRLKSLTLGYDFPIVNSKFITKARVYCTATNLFTITNYSGFDPEVSSKAIGASQIDTPGVDTAAYPRAKTFSLGFSLIF